MSVREGLNHNGQSLNNSSNKPGKQAVRPRSKNEKRKMNTLSPEGRHPHQEDVDMESIPLTDREAYRPKQYQDKGRLAAGNGSILVNGGQPVVAQMPNSVPSDMEDETTVRSCKKPVTVENVSVGGNTVGVGNSDGKETVLNQNTRESVKHSPTDKHSNGSVKLEKGMEHISIPIAANNVPRKQSLTVPGSNSAGGEAQQGPDRSRSDSIFSMGRESSKLSLGSPRSLEMKVQYAAVQMSTDDKNKSVFTPDESLIRMAIPYLPLWVAITCLLMNITVPGSGTILSGCCIFCCAMSRVPAKYDQDRLLLMCVNVWVGVAQLFTVSFLLVGWFWSLAWGIKMVILSVERRREIRNQRAKELQTLALSAFGSAIPARLSDQS